MEIKEFIYVLDSPPLSVIAAAKITSISLPSPTHVSTQQPSSLPTFVFSDGSKLAGTNILLRYIGRVSSIPDLYQRADPLQSSLIDQWLEYAPILSVGSEFESVCSSVDSYLCNHTLLVGHSPSIADISLWCSLTASGQRWESLRKSKKYPSLVRWFNSLAEHYHDKLPQFSSVKAKGISSKAKEIRSENGATAPDVELPGAVPGKVTLRFAPEPSGFLHIGHAKAALLNQYFADKYNGKLILRFDDTNPAKEKSEFVENLMKDVHTMGVKYERITHTSDYFPQLMEMAEKLIKQGKAYVDNTPREQMQLERRDGIESKHRNNSCEENLKLWKEMIEGSEIGLQCCLRGKLDMSNLNKSLRDPVYYRCNPIEHHRIGSKYKIYPTYDFACPFVDAIENITHALRSSEYHDRNDQYFWIQEDMGFPRVQIYEFSRLNMVYTLLSKRNLRWFVDNGKVDGWDDPRFPTVQGIIRRGLKVEALVQFIVEQGASKNLNLMEWDKLWTINKKIIDPVCPRHTAVMEESRVLVTLTNGPKTPFVRVIPRHKKFEGAGEKATTYTQRIWIDQCDANGVSEGEEITLMDWGNAIMKEIVKNEEGKVVRLVGLLHLEGSVKTTKLKATWLPEIEELVNLSLVEFDYLITKKKLEEEDKVEDKFMEFVNSRTKWEIKALGDSNMRNLKKGEVLQLERKGYYRCDVPFVRPSKPIVLFAIPDGRQAK